MPRLFHALPLPTEPWSCCLVTSVDGIEFERYLELWNDEVTIYPLPLSKAKAKLLASFKIDICKAVVDLWRYRLANNVGLHITTAKGRTPLRCRVIQKNEDKPWWTYVAYGDVYQHISAYRLLHLDGNSELIKDRTPLGHLCSGLCWLVDLLVGADLSEIMHLKLGRPSGAAVAQEVKNPEKAGVIKTVAIPLTMSLTAGPDAASGKIEKSFFFYQRQSFMHFEGA